MDMVSSGKTNTLYKDNVLQEQKRLMVSKKMRISVRILLGGLITLDVDSFDTIQDVKAKIEDKQGTPVDHQRLIFSEKQLEDNRTLAYYNIKTESVMDLCFRLTGGGGALGISYKARNGKTFSVELATEDTSSPTDDDSQRQGVDSPLTQSSSWLQRLTVVVFIKKWGYRFLGAWK